MHGLKGVGGRSVTRRPFWRTSNAREMDPWPDRPRPMANRPWDLKQMADRPMADLPRRESMIDGRSAEEDMPDGCSIIVESVDSSGWGGGGIANWPASGESPIEEGISDFAGPCCPPPHMRTRSRHSCLARRLLRACQPSRLRPRHLLRAHCPGRSGTTPPA